MPLIYGCNLYCFCVSVFSILLTDTAAKLAATKAVAADANATAIDVLERLGDLNLQLRGLQSNYSELEDTVNAANQMIQDPEKNSKVLYSWLVTAGKCCWIFILDNLVTTFLGLV